MFQKTPNKNLTDRPVLAVVSDAIYPYNIGGKETRIYQLTTRLAKLGWDVHVFTMNWASDLDNKVENGITYHVICPKYPIYSGGRRSIKEGILFGISTLKLLTFNFDLLEVDSMPYFPIYFCKIVSLLKGKPLVAVWHEAWSKKYWIDYLGVLGVFGFWLEKLSAILPNLIIAVSQHTKEAIQSKYGRSSMIQVVTNGIDMEFIKSVKPSPKKLDYIYTGRLLAHKNIDILINAYAELVKSNATLRLGIMGDGPEKQSLQELTKKLKLDKQIQFINFADDIRDVYAQLKSSKVFVLPSSREGFGLAAIEANACGIPVITVNEPDNAAKDLVKNGVNGYIYAPNTTAELEKYMVITYNYAKTPNSKNISYTSASAYDWDNQSRILHKVYEHNLM